MSKLAKEMRNARNGIYNGTSGSGSGNNASGNETGGETSDKDAQIADLTKKQPTGNAGTGDVLETKTFSNSSSVGLTGTMKNRGVLNWSGVNTTYSIPAGYYSGGTIDSRPSYNSGVQTFNWNNVHTYVNVGNTSGYNFGGGNPVSYTMQYDGIFIAVIGCVRSDRFPEVTVLKNTATATRLVSQADHDHGVVMVVVKQGDIITIQRKSAVTNLYLDTAMQLY